MNVLMLGDAEGLRRQLLPGQEQQLQITQLRSGGCTNAQIAAACHAEYASLETLRKCSDILSLHLAVTPQTVNMVDADFLAGMKDGAFVVNTARGDLVDSAALAGALCSGKIAGAGLDTIAPEPVTPENPLLCLPHDIAENVICSPHIAGITGTSGRRNYRMIAAALQTVQNGQRPENIVNGL